MKSKVAATMLAVSALAIGCQPTPQSNADTTTTTTSSSTVQTLGGASAIDSGAATAGTPGTPGAGSKTTKPVSSTSKSGSKIKSDPLADPTIRGRDSVIRFPLKTLPMASSTPTRE